jgi:hypothetical protein
MVLILALGILAGTVGFLTLKITTFAECERAGWLVRGMRVYDNIGGSAEKECFLWTGKSFIQQEALNTAQKWESKIDEQSAVTITVTPIDISPESKEWKFNVVMSTHSVELDQDMTDSSVLIDDQGKEHEPLTWEGLGPGGHHREGTLTFNVIEPLPKYVELKIKNIGGAVERSFRWSL